MYMYSSSVTARIAVEDVPVQHGDPLDQAVEFLRLLDPTSEEHTFQTFDDCEERSDPSLTRVLHGSLSTHLRSLQDLNERGAGVFVTVNRTDGRGRRKPNITGVRAVFGEFDEGGPEQSAFGTIRHR
jgi:hypothetical protein